LAGVPKKVRRGVDAYHFPDGRRIYLLGEGRLVNLAVADGHPAEIMDMSFGLQILALKYLLENRGKLGHRVHLLPAVLDEEVARLKLKSLGIGIDDLSIAQKRYLESWEIN
ncbi:MAG: adenosylhomocysteinase, partial [Dethiobacteria bacterium]|jgi:adenosylhomocysteinase